MVSLSLPPPAWQGKEEGNAAGKGRGKPLENQGIYRFIIDTDDIYKGIRKEVYFHVFYCFRDSNGLQLFFLESQFVILELIIITEKINCLSR